MNWLNNLSLKAKLGLLAGAAVVGLTVFGIASYSTLHAVKIGGDEYQQLETKSAAVADIAPPPANLLIVDWWYRRLVLRVHDEEYETAKRLYQGYKQARKEYAEAVERWRKHPELYAVMPFEDPNVQKYLQMLDTHFEPAFERGDWNAVTDKKFNTELGAALRAWEPLFQQSAEKLQAMQTKEEETAAALVRSRSVLMGIVFFTVLAAVGVLSVLIARQILGVVSQVQRAASQLAQGDLTTHIPVTGRDELGQLANSINQAIQSLGSVLNEAKRTAQQVSQQVQSAAQSLSQVASGAQQVGSVATDSARGVEQMAQETRHANEMMTQLRAVVQEVARGAEQTAQAAQSGVQQMNEVARVVREVAQGAEQTAQAASTGVERMHTIAERIRATFQQLQETQNSANQASAIALQGRGALEQSQKVMVNIDQQTRHVARELQELANLSASIGGILQTIEEIARQTNLLALNAAIEAARAGEAGRGFAVVAEEVRRLAERSANATREIQQIIQQVLTKTEQTVQAMEQSLSAVQEGAQVSQEVAHGLGAILQAVETITQQVEQSAQSMNAVQNAADATMHEIEQIAAIAQQSSAAGEEMLASTEATSTALQQIAAIAQQSSAGTQEMTASVDTTSSTLGQMASLAQQVAASSQQVNATAQEQVSSIQQLNRQMESVRAAGQHLTQQIARFKLAENGAPPAQSFGETIEFPKAA
ncbi:MAG: hypothetical protein KatS3mg019_0096 [Fimbriimonadales bacterium]|nr:MAG: hypothetical protein KatS3mg019_0096 [Fimbriimonadales bacterium]